MSPKADSEEIQSDAAAKKPVASLRVLLFIKWKIVFLLTNCPRYYVECVVCHIFFVAFFARLLDIAPPSGVAASDEAQFRTCGNLGDALSIETTWTCLTKASVGGGADEFADHAGPKRLL